MTRELTCMVRSELGREMGHFGEDREMGTWRGDHRPQLPSNRDPVSERCGRGPAGRDRREKRVEREYLEVRWIF